MHASIMYPEILNKLIKVMEGYQVSHMSILWLISDVFNTFSVHISFGKHLQ